MLRAILDTLLNVMFISFVQPVVHQLLPCVHYSYATVRTFTISIVFGASERQRSNLLFSMDLDTLSMNSSVDESLERTLLELQWLQIVGHQVTGHTVTMATLSIHISYFYSRSVVSCLY